MKDDIITKNYKVPLEIKGKTIKILKELPRKVLQQRKEYRTLTEKLKNYKARYRWEIPEGLSFNLEEKRYVVKNLAQMKDTEVELECVLKNRQGSEKEQDKREI